MTAAADIPPAPWRKVTRRQFDNHGGWLETLDCGHLLTQPYAKPRAARRRCRDCAPLPQRPIDPAINGMVFVTPSGRQWSASPARRPGYFTMTPFDAYLPGGGVKARTVHYSRLDGTDKTWKRA